MSPQRWSRVRELFDSALDLPPAEVEDYLLSACEGDSELLGEVRQMLAQHRAAGFLDVPPAPRVPVFRSGEVASGRYRILRPLGRGGMGQVYEAEDIELHERVALKTLLPEIAADANMISRFKREIMLARKIGHPHVCRVFDLARHPADGSAPNPALFLTMEFLEGETLAERMEREGRIAPAEALTLLAQMADALDAAHRAGIIHRDFKPGNVMLVPGERGAVVTDFGLARSAEISGDTTATASGQLVGTIDYMAPELFTGEAATAAADQYALALVAYKMVSGTLPFQSDSPLAGVVRRAGQKPPAAWEPWDQALVRALDPEPTGRFASCTAFVEALSGRSQSVTLSLPRLTRRKWAGVVAAAVVLLASPFAWRAWQRAKARPSPEAESYYQQGVADLHAGAYFAATKALERSVAAAPNFALARARLAEAWTNLDLTDKATQEMLIARRQDLSGASLLDRLQLEAVDLSITREFGSAAAKYEQMLPLAGQSAGDLYLDLGRAYELAGKPDKATQSYRHSAEAPSQNPAAWLKLASVYNRAGNFKQADEAFSQAEQIYSLSSNLEGLTEVLLDRGIAYTRRGNGSLGREYLKKAMHTASLAANVQQEINAELHLANNAYLSGDSALAEHYSQEALHKAQINHIEALAVAGLVNLGNAHVRKGDSDGAEKYLGDALISARATHSPHLVALCQLSLAALHDQKHRYAEAAREAEEALAFYSNSHWNLETFQLRVLLGRSQRSSGDYASAQKTFGQLLASAENAHDRGQMMLARESLGSLLTAEERFPEALDHYAKALELSSGLEQTGYAALHYGRVLWTLGRFDEARQAFERAAPAFRSFPALGLLVQTSGAEMSVSQRKFGPAMTFARKTLTTTADPSITARLRSVLCEAELETGNQAAGARDCQVAAAAQVTSASADDRLAAHLALLRAAVAFRDRVAAVRAFHQVEADLPNHPEVRWRFLSLLSRVTPEFAEPARQAYAELGGLWGTEAFRTYATRPDVAALVRPLFQSNTANSSKR